MSDAAAKIEAFNARAQSANWPMRCEAASSFNAPVLREAYALWREKTGARNFPSRTDMTPRAMKNFLANVAIVDAVREAGTIRYRTRVTGSKVERYYGVAAPGTFLDEVVPATFCERWSAMWNLSLDIAGPLRMTSRVQFRNQEYLNMESLVAPLGDGEADAVLQVSEFQSASDAAPRR